MPSPPPSAPGDRAATPERERIADALARHVLALLPPEPPPARADLARLPLAVGHHLEGVLDHRLVREAALPESAWFDGDAEPVQEAARAWLAAVQAAGRFPAGEWEPALHDAVRQVLTYLVEPVEALAGWVYGEEAGSLPVEVVRERMAAFAPYPYLREIAEGYFARKGVGAVSREELERLLRRIDRRMVSLFGPHDWLALLEPLFTLVRPLPEEGQVPTPLLRRFFAAKGYDDLADSLDAEGYDEAALRDTLAAVLPDLDEAESPGLGAGGGEPGADRLEPRAGHFEPEAPQDLSAAADPEEEPYAEAEPGAEVEPDPASAIEPEAERYAEAELEPESEPEPTRAAAPAPALAPTADSGQPTAQRRQPDDEPLWMRLARDRGEAPVAPAEPEPQPPAPSPQPPADEPEPLWKRFAAAPDEPQPARPATPREPLARLETRVLGPSATERRDWYVRQLTAGSEAAYRDVLEQLDAAPNWTEATQIIAREIFRRHQVNIYSDAAVAFTDAVEARFARMR